MQIRREVLCSNPQTMAKLMEVSLEGNFKDSITPIDLIMMSRAPRTITSWGNIVSPFRLDTWLSVLIVLIVIAISLLVSHRVYVLLKIPVKDEPSPIYFFLFTLCKVTEPEPLPWFRSGTAGHLFVFIWTVFACIMVLFYLSNLRAYLMTLQYEEPIETLQDVVDNNRRVWMQNSLVSFTSYIIKKYLSYSLIILKKNSPGTEYASSACQTVVEAGLMGKYLTEYLPSEALLEPQLPRLGLSPISFVNFLTSFIFFATGILLSTVTFVFQDFLSNKHIRNY